jgi:hypothetical protein
MDCHRLILRHAWAVMVALMLCTGCVYIRGPRPPETSPYQSPRIPAAGTTASNPSGNVPPAEMAAVMAEVQQLGAVDPAAQNALLDALQKTDPSLWPQLIQTYRTSVAFHQEARQRDFVAAQQAQLAAAQSCSVPAAANQIFPPGSQPVNADQGVRLTAGNTMQGLPELMGGPIAPKSPPAEFVASYPNTRMPEVHLCGAEETAPTDWHDQLATAIKTLEARNTATDGATSPLSPTEQKTLQMLYLAAGRRDEAVRMPSNAPDADREFWDEELTGVAAALDEQHLPDAQQRATEAAEHLRNAAGKLGESATLVVRNLAFCTEVLSYGIYKPFPKYDFKPGQEAVLYAEVENFASQPDKNGYHTALKSRYQIVDSRGVRVAEQEYAVTEEWCKNPRRDYFVRYFVYMPGRIPSGNYTLQLMVEDTLGRKVARSSVPFTIVAE